MKKIILTSIILLCTLAVQEQCYVGGTLHVSAETNKADGSSATNSVYGISPEFGYNINKMWAVGLTAGVEYAVNGGGGDDITTWGLSPYVRATFAQAGHVKFFAEGALGYGKVEVADFDTDVWSIGILPGILVDLSRKVQLVGRTVLFRYGESGDSPYKVKQTGFSLGNNLEVGILFNL